MRNILKVSVCLLCGEECEFGDREDWCSGVSPHNCYSDAVVCCHTCPALQLPHAQPGEAPAAQVRRPMYGTTTLTTCHCPQSPAAAAAIHWPIYPAHWAVCCCGSIRWQTHGRTPYRFINLVPDTIYAGSAKVPIRQLKQETAVAIFSGLL